MLYEVITAAMMVHPAGANLVTMPSLACSELDVGYRGRASHASAMPEQGINALDALVIAYQAIGVITSYSIHYTKLYDAAPHRGRCCSR